MRDRLIASVSHELRTPLISTLGFIETVLRQDVSLTEAQQRVMIEHARDGGLSCFYRLPASARGQIRPAWDLPSVARSLRRMAVRSHTPELMALPVFGCSYRSPA